MKLFRYMSLKRAKQMFCMWLANVLPLRGHQRYRLVKMGGVNIEGPCMIYKNVGFDSVSPELITIKKGAVLTRGTVVLSHFIDPNQKGRIFRFAKVTIEEDVFIGCNTIICNSVTIGKGAMVAAGSIVTKDIPPYQVWGGNPARYIKDRAH